MGIMELSNDKGDLQSHSRSLAIMPLYRPCILSLWFAISLKLTIFDN